MNIQPITFNPLGIIFLVIFVIFVINLIYLTHIKPIDITESDKTMSHILITIFMIIVSYTLYLLLI